MKDLHNKIILVISFVVLVVSADNDYENKLTKLWSISGSSSEVGRTAVVNVTSASILIEPTSYNSESIVRQPKMQKEYHPYEYKRYAFKPRAIPLKRDEAQLERNVHYTEDPKYKSDVLLPGNYFPIVEVKRKNLSEETTYNPLAGGPFHPKIIPLLRTQEYQRRSLDVDEEPIIERPDGFVEPSAQRRSWSIFGEEDDDSAEKLKNAAEDDEDDDDEDEFDDIDELDAEGKGHKKKKHGHKGKGKLKPKKYAKYMLPLLLAYKLKFFSIVPVMIGGLVLLVGATGLAGFFFALFAATMGLQKGSY